MLTVETRHAIDPATAKGFDTEALRARTSTSAASSPPARSG